MVQETKASRMSAPPSSGPVLRPADLPHNKPTRFELTPDAPAMAALAEALDLLSLRKLRFFGEIRARGKSDWHLTAKLGATIVQPCVVTLDPVTTRIDEVVERTYVAQFDTPEGAEVEMPEDDTVEPLPDAIDLFSVLEEALALNLPAYPRKDGVETPNTVVTEPGKTPLSDAEMRPFAGLAALRDAMKEDEG